ncbi:M81 family metallopeptidase [Mesorhizobium intechi]|nr:M81 family metallopeptidase [Mesorhizobium intechi]
MSRAPFIEEVLMSYRILTGYINQETNTFNKIQTTLEHFRASGLLRGDEIPPAWRGTHTSLGATFEAAEKFGWTLSHPLVAYANPGGIVTGETFEQLCDWFLTGPKAAMERSSSCMGLWLPRAAKTLKARSLHDCVLCSGRTRRSSLRSTYTPTSRQRWRQTPRR